MYDDVVFTLCGVPCIGQALHADLRSTVTSHGQLEHSLRSYADKVIRHSGSNEIFVKRRGIYEHIRYPIPLVYGPLDETFFTLNLAISQTRACGSGRCCTWNGCSTSRSRRRRS